MSDTEWIHCDICGNSGTVPEFLDTHTCVGGTRRAN